MASQEVREIGALWIPFIPTCLANTRCARSSRCLLTFLHAGRHCLFPVSPREAQIFAHPDSADLPPNQLDWLGSHAANCVSWPSFHLNLAKRSWYEVEYLWDGAWMLMRYPRLLYLPYLYSIGVIWKKALASSWWERNVACIGWFKDARELKSGTLLSKPWYIILFAVNR